MVIRKNVRVHHKSITEHSKKPKQKRKPTAKKAAPKLQYTQVDKEVWRIAMELADGDRSRLVIRSETEVSVLNPVFSKKRKEK